MLLRYYFYLMSLCFFTINTQAQVVSTDPVFPTENDAVTIFFDATQGTAGLKDCNCTVYIHTGVITSESTAPSDWKHVAMQWGVENPDWALTKVEGEDNLYSFEITPSIREYYNLTTNEVVEKLAMVFRNGDGSLEGKDIGGADIFYTVYEENLAFTSSLQSPSQTSLIKEIGETIEIRGVASQEATLTITDNGTEVFSTTGTELSYDLTATTTGTHIVTFSADNGEETQRATFSYVVPTTVNAVDPPIGAEDGITILGDTAIYLQLFAPGKDYAFVVGNFTNWELTTDFQMNKSLDGNTHWILVEDITDGDYFFQYLVEGDVKTADPYSTLVLDPNNDQFIDEVTFPNLPAYPADKASGILSYVQVGAEEYDWNIENFASPDQEKLVIYELLVRDFIEAHNYQTLVDTLDYLENLGINAIELLPVNEFEGNISWGYNPSFHMALDKYYGDPNSFKAFIDACHARGIAVILDVVYNHAFSQSPFFQLYNEGGKPSPENPWLNVDATHPFNVGYDFNHESPATKKFVKKVVTYWLEEYRIDGFRFDLSKGFTQVNNPNNVGAWSAYDASRIEILKDYMDTVWEVNPAAYNILEHLSANQEETELIEYGMMVWGNMNHSYNEATMGYGGNNLLGAAHTSRGWEDKHLVSYMESHDEERLMYKNKEFGNTSNPDYNVKQEGIGLHRVELASAFFYTIPGPKMLWQFGEMGYDVNIDFNGRTGPKPIRWEYLNEPDRRRLHDVTAALIKLRQEYEVFCTDDFRLDISSNGLESGLKRIQLNGDDMQVNVIGNFTVFAQSLDPDFQTTGMWYEYFSGEEINVTDVNAKLDMAPGEYRLYTSIPLPEPDFGYISTTDVEEVVSDEFALQLLPNPTTTTTQIAFQLEQAAAVKVEIYNINGQLVTTIAEQRKTAGKNLISIDNQLVTGTYLVKLVVADKVEVARLIVL